MKRPAICREIKLIIFTITKGGILIKNLKMLLILISSAHGWVTEKVGEQGFLLGVESRTDSKNKTLVSGELKMGLGEQWHIMYHLTCPSAALTKAEWLSNNLP